MKGRTFPYYAILHHHEKRLPVSEQCDYIEASTRFRRPLANGLLRSTTVCWQSHNARANISSNITPIHRQNIDRERRQTTEEYRTDQQPNESYTCVRRLANMLKQKVILLAGVLAHLCGSWSVVILSVFFGCYFSCERTLLECSL